VRRRAGRLAAEECGTACGRHAVVALHESGINVALHEVQAPQGSGLLEANADSLLLPVCCRSDSVAELGANEPPTRAGVERVAEEGERQQALLHGDDAGNMRLGGRPGHRAESLEPGLEARVTVREGKAA
jgi:hypothetical protein